MNAPPRLERTVLLVDDSPEDRFAYRRHLGRDAAVAYTFLEAETLQEGLRLYRTAHPDGVLLDYSLPGGTGLDWLDAAREEDEASLPVVLITGTGDERVAAQAIQHGAADYLVKGRMTPSGLSHTLGQAIQRVAADRELRALRREAAARAKRDLRETEDRYLQLVENLPDAVLLLQEGRVAYANAVAGRMLGAATAADLLGQQLAPHVAQEDRQTLRTLIDQAMLGAAAPATELQVRSGGRVVRVEAYVTPVQAEGQPAVQVVLRDVTKLVQALGEAQAAGRAKAAFLSAVSQDVRAPLSAMVGTAQLMQRDVDRPTAIARHAARIERAAERLHRTFSDVIVFAALELDRADLSPEPVDLAGEAVAALERVRDEGEARGVTFEIERTTHGAVSADASGLRRCLSAMFDHAIAAGGTTRVTLRVVRSDGSLQAHVTHDGEALSPDARAAVSAPFGWDDVRTLGLPLAVRLAQAMGGSLVLDQPAAPPAPDGSTSTLALPTYTVGDGNVSTSDEPASA